MQNNALIAALDTPQLNIIRDIMKKEGKIEHNAAVVLKSLELWTTAWYHIIPGQTQREHVSQMLTGDLRWSGDKERENKHLAGIMKEKHNIDILEERQQTFKELKIKPLKLTALFLSFQNI